MRAKKKSLCQRIRRHIGIVFWTILYFIITPIVLCLAIPFYIYRVFVWIAKQIFRKDLHKFIHPRSSVLSRDDFSRNPHWNLVIWLTMEGVLDLDMFRRDFYNEYVNRRESNGELSFPEYQQHYHNWAGFQFWKWDEEFDMNSHIRTYDGPFGEGDEVDDKNLIQIVKHLTWKPWNPKRSPWEFLQIPNYKDKSQDGRHKSIVIFRIHHGLGDGYYILKLLMEDISGISLKDALGKPQYVRRSFWRKLFLAIGFWIRAPYQFIEMIVTANDVNAWHLPLEEMKRPMNAALTDCIPLELVKSIKNAHHVTFTAVMTAAIAGGIRNLMKEKGVDVPLEMHSAVAVPMPGHPPKLRNHFIFSFIELPVGIDDPLKRLKKMDKIYTNLKRNSAPIVNFAKVPLVGMLPPWLMTPTLINRLSTCLISNFPGTPEVPNFKGTPVLDMMFNAGLGEGSCGMGFCLISYVDHIRLISEADPGILKTDEEVEELNQKILEELQIFKSLGTV